MKLKKLFVTVLIMAILPLSSFYVYADSENIPLDVEYDDPNINQGGGHKTPILIPQVFIDGYTLYFYTPCDGCTLRLVNENGVTEYTTIINSSTLILPSYLSGEYEIQIVSGIWRFYGYITL